jgi:hypothetical protein
MKEKWIVELTDTDSEIWDCDIECDSREAAIENGIEYAKEECLSSFRIGKSIECDVPSVDIKFLLDDMQEQLYNEVGECSETYLESATIEMFKELEEQLNEVIYQWHKKYKLEPQCCKIIDEETIYL